MHLPTSIWQCKGVQGSSIADRQHVHRSIRVRATLYILLFTMTTEHKPLATPKKSLILASILLLVG
jgi:hypothetical protein